MCLQAECHSHSPVVVVAVVVAVVVVVVVVVAAAAAAAAVAVAVAAVVVVAVPPFPQIDINHPSSGDCLEGKGENYQVCSVQYCVQQLCTVRCTHI